MTSIAVEQATQLISALQWCAFAAGHKRPLLIAIDQENGSINSLVDDQLITQFPSAMAMATLNSPDMTRRVAAASAAELRCVGINWITGPVLDVSSASGASAIGVRTYGDDPITVLTHGLETVRGFKSAGLACCGKHFPSYGDAQFPDGIESSIPSVDTSSEEMRSHAFIPFRACIQAGMDAVLVGGLAMNIAGRKVKHACLDKAVVTGMLRNDCQFEGVVVSECLAMEALCQDMGISQGATMAFRAGCDMAMICTSYEAQMEGITGLRLAVEDGSVALSDVIESNDRVNMMKDACTSWDRALNPPGPSGFAPLADEHATLARMAYEGAISIVRDDYSNLESIRNLPKNTQILLLTPLMALFPSTATREPGKTPPHHAKSTSASPRLAPGEDRFHSFGEILARWLKKHVVHTSYSSNGLRPMHEQLISQSSAVIILTADAIRNSYQYGVTKHTNMQCRVEPLADGRSKPLVVVALSSPHDFLIDVSVGAYICAYDSTMPTLTNIARLLSGQLSGTNLPPLALARQFKKSRKSSLQESPCTKVAWLVEAYNDARDRSAAENLLRKLPTASQENEFLSSLSRIPSGKIFVVRNSSTKTILGMLISLTSSDIDKVLVDPDRRGIGIEESLRRYASAHFGNWS